MQPDKKQILSDLIPAYGKTREDSSISIIDIKEVSQQDNIVTGSVVAIMPSIDIPKAVRTARILVKRAGMPAHVIIVKDSVRQGFMKTLNATAARLNTTYVVYLAEDAFPGVDWLKIAVSRLNKTGKGLLAFNCGKWRGRIAAFGLVRMEWVKKLYGGYVFYPGYRAHKADNELTVIARVTDQFIYDPDAVLVEYDPDKVFEDKVIQDRILFDERFNNGFDGLAPLKKLRPLAKEYFVTWTPTPRQSSEKDMRGSSFSRLIIPFFSGHTTLGNPIFFKPSILENEKQNSGQPLLRPIIQTLIRMADEALTHKPYSVIDKTSLPPSGNRQDYWHPAPYWWPDPEKKNGLPFIRRDGRRAPGTRMYEPESDNYDRTRLQRVFDDSLVLALAWDFTGEKRYAEHGAAILERFFVNPATRMTPHLKFGQVRMGHNRNRGGATGIIEMKDMYYYLDAVRMLNQAAVIPQKIMNSFRLWLKRYLNWLLTSSQGKEEQRAKNNHGTCYDLQVASIASFLGNQRLVTKTLSRSKKRIDQQFTPNGNQPNEMVRTNTAHYCCFNLQSWINLAELASYWNVDLWHHETSRKTSLKAASRQILSLMKKPWPHTQIEDFDMDRFLPIWFSAQAHFKSLPETVVSPETPYAVKPVFFPHDGIRPFWNLGQFTKDHYI